MKTCTICLIEKNKEEYGILSRSQDGRYPQCKICKSKIDKTYYEKNTEKVKRKANEYYENNRDVILKNKDKEKIKEYNKLYKQQNVEYTSIYNKEYKELNKETIKIQRKQYKLNNKDKIREYSKHRLKTNPLAKLAKSVRRRLRNFLDNKGLDKKYKFSEYIGCSVETLKSHIEKQFELGMTWENHGFGDDKWHLDHRIALGNAQTEKQIYDLCYYKNLQPMWQKPNITKQKKSDICWQKLQRDRLFDEDLKSGFPTNIKAKEFILSHEKITKEHRQFIERYEWLGTIGFGVRHVFTARYNGILSGVVMIAEPNGYQFNKKLEALIQRGACASLTPKNLGSRLVMFSIKWMVNNTDKRIFTAYSDPDAGEIGTIYQACNFDYLGQTFGSDSQYRLLNGKLVGSRHFTRTSSMKKWVKQQGIIWEKSWSKPNGFQNIKEIPEEIRNKFKEYTNDLMKSLTKVKKPPKGKYVLLYKQNKREQLLKTWECFPYPKR